MKKSLRQACTYAQWYQYGKEWKIYPTLMFVITSAAAIFDLIQIIIAIKLISLETSDEKMMEFYQNLRWAAKFADSISYVSISYIYINIYHIHICTYTISNLMVNENIQFCFMILLWVSCLSTIFRYLFLSFLKAKLKMFRYEN